MKSKFLIFGLFIFVLAALCCGMCCAADNNTVKLSTGDDIHSSEPLQSNHDTKEVKMNSKSIKSVSSKDTDKSSSSGSYNFKTVKKVKKYSFNKIAPSKKWLIKDFNRMVKYDYPEMCSNKVAKIVHKCYMADKYSLKVKKISGKYRSGQAYGCYKFNVIVKIVNYDYSHDFD